MKPIRRGLRGAVAAPLSTLMLMLSVAVPLMERAEIRHEAAVESEHDPGKCPPAHDHTVCTQVGANHGAPAGGAARKPAPAVFAQPTPEARVTHRAAELELRPPSRGPPSAAA